MNKNIINAIVDTLVNCGEAEGEFKDLIYRIEVADYHRGLIPIFKGKISINTRGISSKLLDILTKEMRIKVYIHNFNQDIYGKTMEKQRLAF
jgi:hypothetical protein